jgi:hypothetical protein
MPRTDSLDGMRTAASRTATGVAIADAILLAYGLARPDSLDFSIPFLIAPSLALLWTAIRSPSPSDRRTALTVTWSVVVGVAIVVLINSVRS